MLLDANHAAASIVNSAATAPQPQYIKVQPSSLAKASQIDQVKLSALVAWETAKLYANHENVATIGRRLTPAPLRERVTPTQTLAVLAAVICLGLFFLGYLIGFSKLMMASSTLALLLMISSPDWTRGIKENKPIKLVVQQSVMNLGTRWKEMLKHSTGYDISYNMAVGSMILVLLWTGKKWKKDMWRFSCNKIRQIINKICVIYNSGRHKSNSLTPKMLKKEQVWLILMVKSQCTACFRAN